MNAYGSNPSPADLFHFLGMYISSALGLDAVTGTFIGAGLGVYLVTLVVMQVLSLLLKDEDDISGIQARNRTRFKTIKYILRTVLGIYTVPIKLLFGAVAAPILFVANYLIPRRLVNAVGNLVTPERVDAVYELLFRFRLIREALDRLLVGGAANEEAYAREIWPEDKFEVLYIADIPQDIWRGVVWDGRLPGGRHVPWLAWRHCTDVKTAALWRGALKVGFRAGIVFGLVTMVLSVLCQAGHLAAFAYPSWTTSTVVIAKWWVSVGIHGVLASLGSAVVAALAGACFAVAVTYAALSRRLESWWADQSHALTLHTRDSTVLYGNNHARRPNVLLEYTEQVKEAVGRLKKEPLIRIGRATGFTRRMGKWDAPIEGEDVFLDGESIRQNTIFLGGTGTGKTRNGISPYLHKCLEIEWEGSFGAMIFDGKGGTLARREFARIKEGMATGEFPKRPLYRIGVGEGMQAMDVITPMSALRFRLSFEKACTQVSGGDDSSKKWTSFAGGCMEKAKEIGNTLAMDPDWDCDPMWERFTPGSLLGCYSIAVDKEVTQKCIARINELRMMDDLPEKLRKQLVSANLKSAIEYFQLYWFKLNADTKSSIESNINSVVDKISGAGELRDRFFTGRYEDLIPIGAALDGAVVCVDIDSSHAIAGQITNIFLFQALTFEADERFEADPESCKTKTCAIVIDEYHRLCGDDDPEAIWSVCREKGLFGIVGTQSFAQLYTIWGEQGMKSAMVNLSNIFSMRIPEMDTVKFFVELSGSVLQGHIISESMGYENQCQREKVVPDVGIAVNENGNFAMSDLLIREPSFGTPKMRQAAELNMAFVPTSGKEKLAAEGAAHQRHEDQIEKRLAEGLERRPIFETEDFQLGGKQAFGRFIRAGRVQFDILDMRLVA